MSTKLILLDSLLQEVCRSTGQVLGLRALLFGTPIKLNGREASRGQGEALSKGTHRIA